MKGSPLLAALGDEQETLVHVKQQAQKGFAGDSSAHAQMRLPGEDRKQLKASATGTKQ